MTDEEKLYQAYYQPDRLWTGNKAIKELHKITSMSKKDIKSWLAKQELWQVYTPPPKKINHRHYDVRKPNEQHQFDLVHMPHNFFEGSMYMYLLTGVDEILKSPRPLRPKNQTRLHLCWKQSISKAENLNIQRHFNVVMGLSLRLR